MPDPDQVIADNVALLRERIANAANSVGRDANEVTLVGVTKYVTPELARLVFEAGVVDLGESRPQALLQKQQALKDLSEVRWHLIGQLQRNKARRILPLTQMIHSVDRWKLLSTLNQLAVELDIQTIDVLLEVNVSQDQSKHGFDSESLQNLMDRLDTVTRIRVCGLMAMGGRTATPTEVRHQFATVRELRDSLRASAPENAPMQHLSMGMSGDYEIGVKEGATLVRIGSGLFRGIEA
jgi:PLP dependent protein